MDQEKEIKDNQHSRLTHKPFTLSHTLSVYIYKEDNKIVIIINLQCKCIGARRLEVIIRIIVKESVPIEERVSDLKKPSQLGPDRQILSTNMVVVV